MDSTHYIFADHADYNSYISPHEETVKQILRNLETTYHCNVFNVFKDMICKIKWLIIDQVGMIILKKL